MSPRSVSTPPHHRNGFYLRQTPKHRYHAEAHFTPGQPPPPHPQQPPMYYHPQHRHQQQFRQHQNLNRGFSPNQLPTGVHLNGWASSFAKVNAPRRRNNHRGQSFPYANGHLWPQRSGSSFQAARCSVSVLRLPHFLSSSHTATPPFTLLVQILPLDYSTTHQRFPRPYRHHSRRTAWQKHTGATSIHDDHRPPSRRHHQYLVFARLHRHPSRGSLGSSHSNRIAPTLPSIYHIRRLSIGARRQILQRLEYRLTQTHQRKRCPNHTSMNRPPKHNHHRHTIRMQRPTLLRK